MIYDYNNALQYLKSSIEKHLSNKGLPELAEIASAPLNDSRFHTYPASGFRRSPSNPSVLLAGHHCYKHGLLVHTAQVLDLSLSAASALKDDTVNAILVLSSVFHDYPKVADYVPVFYGDDLLEVNKTPHYYNIGHIASSVIWFTSEWKQPRTDIYNQVLHCLLSHHGRPEWGSAVTPNTATAYILHNADNMSAKLYGKRIE